MFHKKQKTIISRMAQNPRVVAAVAAGVLAAILAAAFGVKESDAQ